MRTTAILSLIAGFLLTAATPVARADAMITKFTVKNVTSILSSVGAQDVSSESSTDNGKTIDVISFSNGATKFIAIPTVCDATGCLGLYMSVMWQNGGSATLATVNKFNETHVFGRAFLTDNNLVAYGRYTIADGGVSEANVKSNITNFVGGANVFVKFIKDNQVVAMQTPAGAPTATLGMRVDALSPDVRAALSARAVNDVRQPVRSLAPANHVAGN